MGLFDFSHEEILTFFAVMMRFGVLVAVLPFVGDQAIPAPVKVLLGLVFSIILYPVLVSTGHVDPARAAVWGASAGGITGTIAKEVLFGLALGFACRLFFDAIQIGADLTGTFMGFAAASQFDPHQETQTQVIAQFQLAIAMLLFLTLDGHHVMLRGALESYRIVGLGEAELGGEFSRTLVGMTGEMLRIALQLAAPMAFSLFAINIVYAVMAKAMPQLNVLVLSLSVSALIGLFVVFASLPEFGAVTNGIFGGMGKKMGLVMKSLSGG